MMQFLNSESFAEFNKQMFFSHIGTSLHSFHITVYNLEIRIFPKLPR